MRPSLLRWATIGGEQLSSTVLMRFLFNYASLDANHFIKPKNAHISIKCSMAMAVHKGPWFSQFSRFLLSEMYNHHNNSVLIGIFSHLIYKIKTGFDT